ncbi:hypothetical protein FJT64_017883 [Amphibalanus amphitrite]|uniref:Apple domain-containing protein n=1 Tax=Amphibalanus amphitrite TaxID=1232801 RepID=A0A6A4XA99_AMPAM|nr:hypothetical protein FJT64_017883 [Amphibalanus amphitrite]
MHAASLTQCGILCQRHDSCWGFNFLSGSGACQLLPASIELCGAEAGDARLSSEPGGAVGLLCPHTCLQLLQLRPATPGGLHQLAGWPVPALCDQELDGGGWTLLLTSVSQSWTEDGTLNLLTGRNQQSPTISGDYSILEHGDYILSFGTGDRFLYRLEGQAETGRQQWGGIWSSPRVSSLVRYAPDVTTQLVTRFSEWTTTTHTVEDRLPWINVGFFTPAYLEYALTTSADGSFWGTLITRTGKGFYSHSPWMMVEAHDSGTVLYWVRENE